MKFAVITLPYSMETDEGTAAGPKALLQAGLAVWLREQGHDVAGPFDVKLTGKQLLRRYWCPGGAADVRRLTFSAPRYDLDRRSRRLQHARNNAQRDA
jgi:hypothetical protein